MEFQEITDEIDYIERTFPINSWKVGEIHIWPLIRICLRNQLLYKYNQNTYNAGVLSKGVNLKDYALSTIKYFFFTLIAKAIDARHNSRINGSYDVLFHTVTQDRISLDGCYYNRLCDPLIERLDEKGVRSAVIESSPIAIKLRYPRYGKSSYIQHRLTLARVRSIFKTKIFNKVHPNLFLEHYDELQKYILDKYEIEIWDRLKINEQSTLLVDLKNCYSAIISKGQFRVGIITMYYSIDGMAFILACKEKGMITCDLQHGLQGDYHVAYGRWNHTPENGYEVLPRYFMCWSDFEANAIRKWNKNICATHSPLVIGNLFIKKWKNDEDEHVKKYDSLCRKIKKNAGRRSHILYTLQDYTIPSWIIEVIKKTEDDIYWWVRMHPEQIQYSSVTQKSLQERGIYNYNLIDATGLPLYAILRNVDIHLTGWSTTVLEAAEFGVPSIITDNLGKEVYSNEIKNRKAFFSDNEESLIIILEEITESIESTESIHTRETTNVDLAGMSTFLSELASTGI